MAYDEGLAARVRIRLEDRPGYGEKKMFGGLCFLLNGNMSCGISGDRLMARVGPEAWEEALSEPGAREMDFTGRSLKGFVYVDEDVLRDDAVLDRWVDRAAGFAGALPPK
jgi:TfoX/Sxy family transcriptional regulator of competence genes